MKNVVIGILLVASLALAGLCLHQSRKSSQAQARIDDLQKKLDEAQSNLEEQEGRTTHLSEQLEQVRADAAAKTHEAAQTMRALQESLTNHAQLATAKAPAQTNSKPSNPLSEMFKNPAMKEMIKNQQKTALGAMLDKNYAKLFSDLGLTPEQASALKDMILNKQLEGAQMGMSLLSDEQDAAKRAELVQQVKAASDAADAQIKEFLGDENFAQFQAYEKSMGERMAISGFKDQLGNGPTALTGNQEQQLLQAMTLERQNFKFTTDFSDKTKFTGDFASMFTEDKMNGYFDELGQLNQQYRARAQSILTSDQLTAFDKYLSNQQVLQKAGMQMAAKMFASPKPGGD